MKYSAGFSAVILAGGDSSRFSFSGSGCPNKIFADVFGVPLIVRSLEPFFKCDRIENLVIVAKEADFNPIKDLLSRHFGSCPIPVFFVRSGSTRAESARSGIRYAHKTFDSEFALVSDAARCNTPLRLIESVCDGLNACDNSIPCIRHEETFKVIAGGRIAETIKRSDMYEVQTPQGYRLSKLVEAFDACFDSSARDESEIYFAFYKNENANIVIGFPGNIKVTRPDDLKLLGDYYRSLA